MTITAKKTKAQTIAKKRVSAKATPAKKVTQRPAASPKTTVRKTATQKSAANKTAAKPSVRKKLNVQAVSSKAPSSASVQKTKKSKLVRDSFTIPKNEYVVLDALKARAIAAGQAVKKSELLRAGIKALAAMSEIQFKAALSNVPPIKTGRPKKTK